MKAQIVSFHCILKNRMGRVLSSTFNQEVITQADARKVLLPGLVAGLQDLHPGEKRRIALSADEAYGFYNPELVMEVSRKELPKPRSIQVGSEVLTETEEGETRLYRVVQIDGDQVTLDANHPLAGQDLVFDIEATDVRDATPEEIKDSGEANPPQLLH